ncbi:MAG: DUF3761 domain-containing protein [Bacteroidaceae bacterium]|nr:DUF3761 domain-containing protein [Bacteroidaceae bacterium]
MSRFLLCLSVLLTMFNINGVAHVRYVTTNLNLRFGPGTEYEVITSLPKGTPVSIDEDCDCKWVLVEYGGNIGYISTKYLSSNPPHQEVKRETRISTYNTYATTHNTGVRYYTNVDGYRVQSPTYYDSTPAGATALCRDGTYSFSRNRRGTCSHHGGVARWL